MRKSTAKYAPSTYSGGESMYEESVADEYNTSLPPPRGRAKGVGSQVRLRTSAQEAINAMKSSNEDEIKRLREEVSRLSIAIHNKKSIDPQKLLPKGAVLSPTGVLRDDGIKSPLSGGGRSGGKSGEGSPFVAADVEDMMADRARRILAEVLTLKKSYDDLRKDNDAKDEQLVSLMDEYRSLEVDLANLAANPYDALEPPTPKLMNEVERLSVRMRKRRDAPQDELEAESLENVELSKAARILYNRCDKALLKQYEAESMSHTYEHMLQRLREEYNQGEAMQDELHQQISFLAWERDRAMLKLKEAEQLRNVAQQSLAETHKVMEEERALWTRHIAERKEFVEMLAIVTGAESERGRMVEDMKLEEKGDMTAAEEKTLKAKVVSAALRHELHEKTREELKETLRQYEERTHYLQEVTGLEDLTMIAAKLTKTKQTGEELTVQITDAQKKLEKLSAEYQQLLLQRNEYVVTDGGTLMLKDLDRADLALAKAGERLDAARKRHTQTVAFKLRAKASLIHLLRKLLVLPDNGRPSKRASLPNSAAVAAMIASPKLARNISTGSSLGGWGGGGGGDATPSLSSSPTGVLAIATGRSPGTQNADEYEDEDSMGGPRLPPGNAALALVGSPPDRGGASDLLNCSPKAMAAPAALNTPQASWESLPCLSLLRDVDTRMGGMLTFSKIASINAANNVAANAAMNATNGSASSANATAGGPLDKNSPNSGGMPGPGVSPTAISLRHKRFFQRSASMDEVPALKRQPSLSTAAAGSPMSPGSSQGAGAQPGTQPQGSEGSVAGGQESPRARAAAAMVRGRFHAAISFYYYMQFPFTTISLPPYDSLTCFVAAAAMVRGRFHAAISFYYYTQFPFTTIYLLPYDSLTCLVAAAAMAREKGTHTALLPLLLL
eukprot:jgi/Mesvir1/20598/Mv14831-RA.2